MKAEDVKIDLEELKRFKKQNAIERLKFIDFMVEYIKKNPDEEWSKGQALLIDSQVLNKELFHSNLGNGEERRKILKRLKVRAEGK